MEFLGREHPEESQAEPMEAHLSFLNLINVPTMFDIGCTQPDPQTDSLTLCMMDSITHKVVKQHLSKTGHREAAHIEKMRQHMQAIHTNMLVSSTDILFDQNMPLVIDGAKGHYLTIDGNALHKQGSPLEIAKISVSRLLIGDGETQACVPVMTYLPLKEGELKNQHIQYNK